MIGTEGQVNRMRLIDADAFIEYLGLDAENAREDNIGEIVTLEDFDRQPTAFDKEKIIEELKSWEKASHDAGIQSTYAELDNKASGYYQESWAYHRAIEIVEKGGIE